LHAQSTFEKLEDEIAEVNTNAKALRKNFFELNEFRTLLKYSGELFDEVSKLFCPYIYVD
jgi:hypothetical protein